MTNPSRKPPVADRAQRAAQVWTRPSASKASRKFAENSRGSVRGILCNPKSHREMYVESNLEGDLAHILIEHKDVEEVREQPDPVKYIDAEGKIREHTFDFLVTLKSGTRIAIAVKPEEKVASSGIEDILARIRKANPTHLADHFILRTSRDITREAAYNARLIRHARKVASRDDILAVMKVATTLKGAAPIRDLVAAAGADEGYGFMAVICLIADGLLGLAKPGRISLTVRVRPTIPATA